ncbi:MAG: hypothetical protein IT452_09745 [Planctomycetia bacterium]|nr:hypothetical protein [Planctomycetia bacterium]
MPHRGAGRTPGQSPRDPNKTDVLNPGLAAAFYNCGLDRQDQGDFAGAISDFSQTLRFEPEHFGALMGRAFACVALLNWRVALADLRAMSRIGLEAHREDSLRLQVCALRMRLGERQPAVLELRDYFARRGIRSVSGWSWRLAGFLCGTVTERDLLTGLDPADGNASRSTACEGYWHAATVKAVAGDTAAARERLSRCAAFHQPTLAVWWAARSELARLPC